MVFTVTRCALAGFEQCIMPPKKQQRTASAENQEMHFIVSTPQERGVWYKERGLALSLINSHVAKGRNGPNPGSQKRSQKDELTCRTHGGLKSFPEAVELHCLNVATKPSLSTYEDCGLSLTVLQDIFAGAESDAPRNCATMRAQMYGHSSTNSARESHRRTATSGCSQSVEQIPLNRVTAHTQFLDGTAIRQFPPEYYSSLPTSVTTESHGPSNDPVSLHTRSIACALELPRHIDGGLFPFRR